MRAFESLEETSNHALSPHPIQHNHVTRYPYHAIYHTTTSYRGMIPTLPPILAILSLHTFASHRARRCHSRYYSLCSLRPRLAHRLWGWVCVSAMCGEVTCPPHPSPLPSPLPPSTAALLKDYTSPFHFRLSILLVLIREEQSLGLFVGWESLTAAE